MGVTRGGDETACLKHSCGLKRFTQNVFKKKEKKKELIQTFKGERKSVQSHNLETRKMCNKTENVRTDRTDFSSDQTVY